jgi:RNA polymerase sigma-70 factor (ECF subfamily)
LLERLSPDERAAFVLHEAFDFDYAQIAEVVGKTAAHCRQLAHRARQRLTNAERLAADSRSRARIDAVQPHAGSFEGLRDAIHAADAAGALRVLAQRPMAVEAVASAECRGAHSGTNAGAARATAERAVAPSEGVAVEVYALPSDWGGGLALMHACEVVGLVRVAWMGTPSGDWRGRLVLSRSGPELDALNRRLGSRAIAQLLMRIAGRSPMTAACAA